MEPAVKRAGRPKGSLNKPKTPLAVVVEVPEPPKPRSPSVSPPTPKPAKKSKKGCRARGDSNQACEVREKASEASRKAGSEATSP